MKDKLFIILNNVIDQYSVGANVATLNKNTVSDDIGTYWRPTIWSKLVHEEAKSKMYWNRFMGPEGSGMPVILKTELVTEPGQTINISQLANLTGAGVSGSTALRGQEEKLDVRQVQCSPEWYRHAVATDQKAQKQITQSFRLKAKSGLAYWMAKKLDTSMWTAARGTGSIGFEASTISVVFGNNAASLDEIDSADDFGVAEIRKAAAKLAANNIDKISMPGMPAGEGYYLLFIHPYQAYSLKTDSEWIDNHQNAGARDPGNPLFTGSLGEVDGVIVHSTTQCTIAANANSPNVNCARAIMVGQEALCRGLNEDIVWSEEVADYGFDFGIGIRAAWEDKVLSSNAIVHIMTAAIDPTAV